MRDVRRNAGYIGRKSTLDVRRNLVLDFTYLGSEEIDFILILMADYYDDDDDDAD